MRRLKNGKKKPNHIKYAPHDACLPAGREKSFDQTAVKWKEKAEKV